MKARNAGKKIQVITLLLFLASFIALLPKESGREGGITGLAADKPDCEGAGYSCVHTPDACLARGGSADTSFSCPENQFCCAISPEVSCKDADSQDIFKASTCHSLFDYIDTCYDSTTVRENYCTASETCDTILLPCPSEHFCYGGRCIPLEKCSCVSNSNEATFCGGSQFKICEGNPAFCIEDNNCKDPGAIPRDEGRIGQNLCEYPNCQDCTSSRFCGWCKDTNACEHGSEQEAYSGSCSGWVGKMKECPKCKGGLIGKFETTYYTCGKPEEGCMKTCPPGAGEDECLKQITTRLGTNPATKRTIAVDPDVIPLGSKVYLDYGNSPWTGVYIAEDTGGAVKGYHIDVFCEPTICDPYDYNDPDNPPTSAMVYYAAC